LHGIGFPPSLPDSRACQTEEEGFEPPVPCGTAVFKTATLKPQPSDSKELTGTGKTRLQTSLQTKTENTPKQGESQGPKLPAESNVNLQFQKEIEIQRLTRLLQAADIDYVISLADHVQRRLQQRP